MTEAKSLQCPKCKRRPILRRSDGAYLGDGVLSVTMVCAFCGHVAQGSSSCCRRHAEEYALSLYGAPKPVKLCAWLHPEHHLAGTKYDGQTPEDLARRIVQLSKARAARAGLNQLSVG